MKSKKSAGDIFWIVVALALSLFFLFIYSGAWTKLFGKGVSGIKEQFDLTGDSDNDGVINVADKCPCPQKAGSEKRIDEFDNKGCPAVYKIDGSNKEYESRYCFEKKDDKR